MTSPDQDNFDAWPTKEWSPESANRVPEGYDPNRVAPYLPGVEMPSYNADADTTVSLSDPMNGNTIPIRGEEIDKINEAQKSAENQKRIERLANMSEFAGAIMLFAHMDEQGRLANEAVAGSRRNPRYAPNIILQTLDVPGKNLENKSRLQRIKDGLTAPTVTKDPQALLWQIPGLRREVNGVAEHIAVAANITTDDTLPAGGLMVVRGDIHTAPGVSLEVAVGTEAFRKKFPDSKDDDQLEAYFDEPENNFRTLSLQSWRPEGRTWDGDKVEANSSFSPQEIEIALRKFGVDRKLDAAGHHFGFRVPNF